VHVVGQIIEKNLYRRSSCSSGLWINPDKNDNWQSARNHCATLKLFSQDRGSYRYLKEAGANIEFSALPEPPKEKLQWLILNLPRQKALLDMLLDYAAHVLADDGVLWLAGENKAGIKSAHKKLKMYFGRVQKLDNARHCTLYEAGTPLQQSSFDMNAYQQVWTLKCRKHELKVSSYPGVFAHGRLDSGSALLLNALEDLQFDGDVLDFASGAGILGAYVAINHPHARVTLLDTNALALKASTETLALNQKEGSVLASDGLSEVTERYDYIISNPPIHSGVKTDNLLSQKLLADVNIHLNTGGMMIMVANRHLPYESWLATSFSSFIELTKNAQYKVIAARK
jgi:16S rRNA (guanine1207-N2)-methyltransferase